MNESLYTIIKNLIDKKKEGDYWDFKEKYHENNAELLHDILCLSNNVLYEGERYLIFGIADPKNNCLIKGIKNDPNRKKQVEIIDFLSNKKFAGDIRPDISLETIEIDNKEIDVLIIYDNNLKPYFLSQTCKEGTTHIQAGLIYTRIGDKNTARDKIADLYYIELMWRQRFGIDKSPLERIINYLYDFNNWISNGIDFAYYKLFPEFKYDFNDKNEIIQNKWWSNFLGDIVYKNKIIFEYHTTELISIDCCNFRRENIIIPHPFIDYVKIDNSEINSAENTYSFFYFIQNSIEFALLCYFFGIYNNKLSPNENKFKLLQKNALKSQSKPSIKHIPFIIFKDEEEKNKYISYFEKNLNSFFKENNIEPKKELGNNKLKEEELFAYWSYEQYFNYNKIGKINEGNNN